MNPKNNIISKCSCLLMMAHEGTDYGELEEKITKACLSNQCNYCHLMPTGMDFDVWMNYLATCVLDACSKRGTPSFQNH